VSQWLPVAAIAGFIIYTLWLQRKLARMHLAFKADNAEFLVKLEALRYPK